MITEQLPPYDEEIEAAVLGAALLKEEACDEAMELLNPESFWKLEHRHIFQSVINVRQAKMIPDILTVTEELRKRQLLSVVGGPVFISRLTNRVASGSLITQHSFILKEKETARKYLSLGYRLQEMAYNPSFDFSKANDFAADQVQKIMNLSNIKKQFTNTELAREFMDKVYRATESGGITGVPTGFTVYDRLTSGHQPGDMIVWAARPGMGKTALALSAMVNAVVHFKKRIIFFSHEMKVIQLFQRICAIHMNMHSNKFKTGDMSEGDWRYFNETLQPILSENLILVDDCRTLQEMRTRVKKEKLKGPVDEVIVDYLQLVREKGNNREAVVSAISSGLKDIANDCDLPLIALSQLSRTVESRGGSKEPQLSDLRESGAIEQDADVVAFLYRPQYYGIEGYEGKAFLNVEKQRNGNLQHIPLTFIHEMTKFTNPDQTEMPF